MIPSFKSVFFSIGTIVLRQPNWLMLPIFILVLWWNWVTQGFFFFWDTTQLASEHAQFFYDTQFSNPLLPDRMDSGHPPTFGFYLALIWKLFGKTLTVSHLAMLPFLLGIVWQVWILGRQILGDVFAWVFLLVVLVNPVVASQSALVSPDVVLLFFFLLGLNAIFSKNKSEIQRNVLDTLKVSDTFFAIAILGLAAVSMRGMMVAAGLFLFEFGFLFVHFYKKTPPQYFTKKLAQLIAPYLLGGLFASSFLIYHYSIKGWIGYHADSGWAEAFQVVDFQQFIKNLATLGWRLLDFGHLFPIIIIGFWLIKMPKKLPTTRHLLWLTIALSLVLTPTLVIYKGLLTHRYLLPIYVSICLLAVKIISDLKNWRRQIALSLVLIFGLASGNFWVYPQPIATGWDATLAHLPYYHLRHEMLQFIDNQKLSYAQIGTSFPNQRSFAHTDLSFAPSVSSFTNLDFSQNQYIFYANVMNDFSAEQLAELKTNWEAIKILRGGQVEVILYKKR